MAIIMRDQRKPYQVELNNFEQEERVGIEEASEYRIPVHLNIRFA